MKRFWHFDTAVWLLFAALLGATRLAGGAEPPFVAWHADVATAWQATQQQGRPLLVFVTREDCYYCTQMKNRTWTNAAVGGAIQQGFVPLILDGSTPSPLLADLKVTAYPATFVISPQAVVIERFDGYIAPEALARRLTALATPRPLAQLAKDP